MGLAVELPTSLHTPVGGTSCMGWERTDKGRIKGAPLKGGCGAGGDGKGLTSHYIINSHHQSISSYTPSQKMSARIQI